MRYFMRLAYNGAGYHGWQVQPNGVTVQECVERALSTALRTPIAVTGAGRTDAGVNAAMMVAHFDVEQPIADTHLLIRRLNSIVGNDIVIYSIYRVADDAHARFDATSRTYKYFVTLTKSPFDYAFTWHCRTPLDFDLMNEAAERMMGYTDFTSFSKTGTDVKTNICQLTEARWEQLKPGEWRFTVSANRFLRNMVRAIVGTLVEVGRHRMTISQMRHAIEAKDRQRAGESVPGHALYLTNIEY